MFLYGTKRLIGNIALTITGAYYKYIRLAVNCIVSRLLKKSLVSRAGSWFSFPMMGG